MSFFVYVIYFFFNLLFLFNGITWLFCNIWKLIWLIIYLDLLSLLLCLIITLCLLASVIACLPINIKPSCVFFHSLLTLTEFFEIPTLQFFWPHTPSPHALFIKFRKNHWNIERHLKYICYFMQPDSWHKYSTFICTSDLEKVKRMQKKLQKLEYISQE